MTNKPTTRTLDVIKRALHNYPEVGMDALKELQQQSLTWFLLTVNMLRLNLKVIGILLFPLWLPFFALAYFVVYTVYDKPTKQLTKAQP